MLDTIKQRVMRSEKVTAVHTDGSGNDPIEEEVHKCANVWSTSES